ncbi:hypothetical protein [Nocardia sp. XZ_19_385]|uniref:hypothetical protein n=1 Tax=Nocardia sp. XZ_19_385 TaxID=2769488 RepID=UPI00188F9D31|nr:hypothetical protein [Nocardia sp. XZ_19_385]
MTDANDNWMVPGKELLLAACRGLPHEDHPMLDAAGELTQLHVIRERTPACEMAKVDRRRTQLVRAIDRWVTLVTPVPLDNGYVHCESVGQVVDRLAELTSQAIPLSQAPDPVFYDTWVRVGEMADTYQDLVDGLCAGTRRPPARGYWLPADPFERPASSH